MGFDVLNEMFDKVYLSNEIHERKPNVSAFNFVANDAGIDKTESLFIDDTDLNIQGAIKAGLHARLLPKDKTLLNLKQEGVI
ncbi:MAG: HAD-IA family hydrolase, partial [Bacteroidales bacterium]|nr:HAD-IA family hydrolase [Bacteroidales bacterium]